MTKRFTLQFSDLVFTAIFLTALLLGSRMLGIDSDIGRHLTLGNYILDHRFVPTHDLFSHTRAGLSRPPYEWLAQVLFAVVHRLLGLDGVILLTACITAITFTLLYQFTNRRNKLPLLALIIVLVAAAASSLHWLPRPHMFTLFLWVLWLELLERCSAGRRCRILLFPAFMLLWANLHGGFVFGVLAWLAHLAGWGFDDKHTPSHNQIGKRLFAAGILSIAATIITPDSWRNWEAVLNNRSVFILTQTVETMRPRLFEISVLPYTVLLLLVILMFFLQRKNVKKRHLFLLGGTGLMSLAMARNIPLFAIASAPVLAELGRESLSRFRFWQRLETRFSGFGASPGRLILSVMMVVAAILYFTHLHVEYDHSLYQFDPRVFPLDAANYLEANPQNGNMFNEFNWGGYLLYKFFPRYPVFIDSQSDFYGETLLREYTQIINASGAWQALLQAYRVDWALIRPDTALALALNEQPDWEMIYQDSTAVLFRRRGTAAP